MNGLVPAATVVLACVFPPCSNAQAGRLRTFAKAFSVRRKPAEPAVVAARRKLLAAVAKFDSPAGARVLVAAYRNLEIECSVRREKRRRILVKDNGVRLERLRAEMHPSLAFEASIARRIEQLHSPDARAAIGKLLNEKRLPLRLRLLGARVAARLFDAARMKPSASLDLESLLVILEAVKSLERNGQKLGAFALAALRRPEPVARQCAVETLEALCWPGSLRPLIDFVRVEKDLTLRARAGEALAVLTKQDLGTSSVSWKAWLAEQGGPYLRGERPLGGGKAKRDRVQKDGYYFGLPLDQPSILFVQDNSQSMQVRLGQATRIGRSRDELCRALDALGPKQRFNIVLFANRVWQFADHQLEASKKNVTRAKAWVRAEKLEFGTATYNALEQGFVLAGRGSDDRYYEPVIDTMFVLSDGLPTVRRLRARGVHADIPGEILAAVRRWNAFGRIQIHTIYLAGKGRRQPRAVDFMRKLARQNRGRFVEHS